MTSSLRTRTAHPLALVTPVAAALAWQYRHLRSPAAQRWRASVLPSRRIGSLHVRTGGDREPVIVLLHGLVATGDIFGADFDALAAEATLVVPDLLGFGQSLDEDRSTFKMNDHLDALDAVLGELGAADRPIVIGAHSMGAAIAVAWAARRGPKVRSVICWGAPVLAEASDINDALADVSLMARAFAGNDRVAQAVCHLNCSNRQVAGWLAALATPELPVPIARKASLHTWPAYRDAIDDVVAGTAWVDLAETLHANKTSLTMTWGRNDSIGDRDLARSLAGTQTSWIDGAGHHLPLTHAANCIGQLRSSLSH